MTPAHQCKHTSSMGQHRRCSDGDDAHVTWWQRGQRIKDDNAGATRGTMPMQCWGQCRCNGGNNAIVTMAKTPAYQWWQQCHCDKGNNTSLTTSTMPSWQKQQHYCNNGKDAWTAKMPAHQQWQHHCDEGNNASLTTAKMPAHWWWQQPHCYEGNSASLMTMLAQLQQRCHCKDANNCHCTMTKTPACQCQQRHHDKGKKTIAMMARMLVHWWWQQCHCDKEDDASLRTATMPTQQGQQCHCGSRATMPLLQGQQCHLDDSKDAYALTMSTVPSSLGQQLQTQQQQWRPHIDSNNAIATRAVTPAWQQAIRATILAWQ